jgi:hypothetical protein
VKSCLKLQGCPRVKLSTTYNRVWGSGRIAPRISNVGFRWRWAASFTLLPFYPHTYCILCWTGHRTDMSLEAKRKFSVPDMNRTPVVQSATNHFNDSAILPHNGSVIRRCTQKFPDWVDNQIYAYNNTRWEATQGVMATKLTRLTHKIAIQLHLVADSCVICSSRFRRPVRKLLDTPS